MKGLGDRLRRSVGDALPVSDTAPLLREALVKVGHAQRRREFGAGDAISLEEAIGGEPFETPFGPVWRISHRVPLSRQHGARELGGFFTRDLGDVERLTGDERLRGQRSAHACFVDIEATGLEHGAGTMAFLVGVAFRHDDTLVTHQYLLREPSEEEALLHCLLADLDAHPMLVSFNGKSYDLSVLESRMVMCRFLDRQTCRLKLRPHLDLLHLSRNLHRGRWQNTRLGTLESELLGFERIDDLPGALVPSAWFHYLRTGDASDLARAVVHNLHDVWSMVVLADHLLTDATHPAMTPRPPRVTANLGHLLLRRGDVGGAVDVLAPFINSDLPGAVRRDALDTLATAARRAKRTELEVGALEGLASLIPRDPDILRRLSIAFERRARDLPSALAAARQAAHVHPCSRTAARVTRLEGRLRRSGRVSC